MPKYNVPYVVVLILSYNGKDLLRESIPSYLDNTYPNFKVIVIDNGSTDGTRDYVQQKFPSAAVIRLEKNQGYSGGFNFGLEYAIKKENADYILITNDDVLADKDIVKELVAVAETDSKIGFVTGKVYFYDSPQKNVLQTVGKNKNSLTIVGSNIGECEVDDGQYNEIVERYLIDDVFMLVRRKVFEDTKGYNPVFFLQFEESDWQLRSKKLGYKIYYTPHAKLWHKVGMSTGGSESALRHKNHERNFVILVKIHGNKLQFFRFLLYRIFLYLPKFFVRATINGRPDLIMANINGIFSGLIWTSNN